MSDHDSRWKGLTSRPVLSWALYDWANSAFATTVMAGFFPLFFRDYWSKGADPNSTTYYLGLANSIAGALIAFTSPALGAFADLGSARKKMLGLLTALAIVATGGFYLVELGQWELAIVLYVIASFGFAGGNTFNDALMLSVAPPSQLHRVSALGFSLGYLGGGVLFLVNVLMYLKPALFGLPDGPTAVRVSFLTVAVWWTIFSVPIFLFVKEEASTTVSNALVREGFKRAFETARHLARHKNAALFLASYFFYIDGVNTIIKMAVDYGMALGFPSSSLITALLLVQFVGFPSALLFGTLAHRWGEKKSLHVTIGVYALVTLLAYFMTTTAHFYALAVAIGLVQGGIQSISRSVFGSLVPREREAEFFGFFNMLGKFSTMFGPILVGLVSLTTGSARLSILSLLVLFVLGSVILTRVRTYDGAGSTRA